MTFGTPTQEGLQELRSKRTQLEACAKSILLDARAAGRETLSQGESRQFRDAQSDLGLLDERIERYESDLQRVGTLPENLRNLSERRVSSAGQIAPLGYADEQLRRAFEQVGRGETAVLESRAGFNTATPLIPPTLGPILPVFPRHETRLLERLPGIAIDVPAISYVQVKTVTGAAAVVPEGVAKPELLMPAEGLIATARKIAAHTAVSWEAYSGDYGAFVTAVQLELMKAVTDKENQQLYAGTGESNGQVNGLSTATGILTLDGALATGQPGPWTHWRRASRS